MSGRSRWNDELTAAALAIRGLGGGGYPLVVPKLNRWKAAKARGAASPARHAWFGESHPAGEGAGTGTLGLNGASHIGMVDLFAAIANHQTGGWFGDQGVYNASGQTVAAAAYYGPESGLTLGPGWGSDGANSTFGGAFLTAAAGSTGVLSWTGTFASIEMFFPVGNGNTAMPVRIDGQLVDTINETGPTAYLKRVYTVPYGTHTITVGVGATSTAFFSGAIADDGSGRPVTLRGAWCGGKAAQLNNTASGLFYAAGVAAMLKPDFTHVSVPGNDINAGTSVDSWRASVEAIVKTLVAAGSDGCLHMCYPTTAAGFTNGLSDSYANSARSIAGDYGYGFYDARRVFGGSNARATDLGLRFDANHPNKSGQAAWASDVYYNLLLPAGF